MTDGAESTASIVIRHLLEIVEGHCSITREALIEKEGDPEMAQILAGLLFLHEDLASRQTLREQAEAELRLAIERLENQNEELEESRNRLAQLTTELSTPAIKVSQGVVMMPLVGSVDSARASEIADRLLGAVSAEGARHVILDLTGVSMIDTTTANHFLRIMNAVRLLGTQGIVAGIQTRVALALVALGIDLSGITTARNVQEALEICARSS